MRSGHSRPIVPLARGLLLALLAGLGPAVARSDEPPTLASLLPQGAEPPPMASTFAPSPAPTPAGPVGVTSPFAAVGQPEVFAAPISPKVQLTTREVIRESIFGAADKKDWKPLALGTFFTEGWGDPFTNAPEGTNLAPKQNWIGAPAGVFGRFFTVDGFYTNHLNNVPGLFLTPNAPFMPVHTFTTGNQYAGYATILIPLNARLELLLGTVFVDSRKSSPGGGYSGNWGDTGVQARFHLIEQRDFSLVGFIGERIPTGKTINGSGINYVTPGIEFWWNFAPHWVARGGTSINILTGRKTATSVLVNQLSVGRYLTTKDAKVFKELEVHLTASALSDVSGGAGGVNDIYLFPGFRFGLDGKEKSSILGGVNVPVSGPQAFDWQPQISYTRNY